MKQKCPGLRTRGRRTPRQRTELRTQYRRRGLSLRDVVQSHGPGLSTLTQWWREERRTGGAPPAQKDAVPFQEMNLRPPLRPSGWAAAVVGEIRKLYLVERHARDACLARPNAWPCASKFRPRC